MQIAVEFIGNTDLTEIQFKSTEDLIKTANAIYDYLNQGMKEESKETNLVLHDFERND